VYELATMSQLANFHLPNRLNVPKQVAFTHDFRFILSGSDCGKVWLWERTTQERQLLVHTNDSKFPVFDSHHLLTQSIGVALVQTIQTFSGKDGHLVATAAWIPSEQVTIILWRFGTNLKKQKYPSSVYLIGVIFSLIVVFCCYVFGGLPAISMTGDSRYIFFSWNGFWIRYQLPLSLNRLYQH
jgi:hypothetical protein